MASCGVRAFDGRPKFDHPLPGSLAAAFYAFNASRFLVECDWVKEKYSGNLKWVQAQAKENKLDDPYWHLINLAYKQIDGLKTGIRIKEKELDIPEGTGHFFVPTGACLDHSTTPGITQLRSSFFAASRVQFRSFSGYRACLIKLNQSPLASNNISSVVNR